MRRIAAILVGFSMLVGAGAFSLWGDDPEVAGPVLKRVMLSTGGVGYFEYEVYVDGTQDVRLPVRVDQMDDVLKSVVVFDDKGGGGVIAMPSRSPLTEIFRNLPVGPDAFTSPTALLSALKGAEVTVDGPLSATGRIVSVVEEQAQTEDGQAIVRHRVSLMTSSGIEQFVLEDAESVQLDNEELRGLVDRALQAMAENRAGDGRVLTITARGEGQRKVTIGYVVETPLWKTSYRLMTAQEATSARMQGWAILENASGTDWSNVELTLVTGSPVTFRQALYDTYYVSREQIPVEVLGRVLPSRDEGGIDYDADARTRASGGAAGGFDDEGATADMAPPPPPVMAPSPEPYAEESVVVTGSRLSSEGRLAAASEEAATQVIFKIPGTVTVGSGQSLSVPIIDREVPAERIALYQPETHPRHPLATVRLTNGSESSLPPGVITLYEVKDNVSSYVGDARLATFPQGETRMLSFALDQKTLIDREDKSEQTITTAKIANGVMELSIAGRMTTVYTVKAPSAEARKLLIEHQRYSGWELKAPDPAGVEIAGDKLRIPFEVAAGTTGRLEVVLEQARQETVILTNLDGSTIEAYASNTQLSEGLRAAFARMRELRGAIDRIDSDIRTANGERDRLYQEQERIRQNLLSVPAGSGLQARYLDEMGKQEDRIQALGQRLNELDLQRAAAVQALSDYVAGLAL